jgi:hypothetical protein
MDPEQKKSFKALIRNFLIEMVVYGGLLLIYFLLALRYLGEPLARMYASNLKLYSVLSLVLIVAQAVVLEFVVSFLFDFLGLNRLTQKK